MQKYENIDQGYKNYTIKWHVVVNVDVHVRSQLTFALLIIVEREDARQNCVTSKWKIFMKVMRSSVNKSANSKSIKGNG